MFMRKSGRLIASSLFFIFLLAVNPIGMAGQSSVEKELLEVENRITAAFLKKDVESFVNSSDERLSCFHASNPYRMDDRQSIENALKTFYKYSTATGLYKVQPRIQLYGDCA